MYGRRACRLPLSNRTKGRSLAGTRGENPRPSASPAAATTRSESARRARASCTGVSDAAGSTWSTRVEGRNPPDDRYVLLEVTNAGNSHDRYRVSVSKPDFAIVRRHVDPMPAAGSTSGTIGSTVTIRNSSSVASVDERNLGLGRIDRIEVHCRGSAGTPFPSHSFVLLRQGRANFLDAKSEQSLDLGTLCEGRILNAAQPARPPVPATPADQISSVTVKLFVDNMLQHEISTTPASRDWPFDVDNTMWHRQSDMMGGLQLLIEGWCTSSFGVELKPSSAATITHHGNANDVQSMSTTGHCHAMGFQWRQGGITSARGDYEMLGVTLAEPQATTCKFMRDIGEDGAGNRVQEEAMEANCHRGDQTYSEAPVSASFLNSAIFKPHTQSPNSVNAIIKPRIEYFAVDNTGPAGATIRFEIIGARPPKSREIVHKVGRTSGWTSGRVENHGDFDDPTCPGNHTLRGNVDSLVKSLCRSN